MHSLPSLYFHRREGDFDLEHNFLYAYLLHVCVLYCKDSHVEIEANSKRTFMLRKGLGVETPSGLVGH